MVRSAGDRALKQVLLGSAQLGPGLDAEFVGQPPADALELLHGLGLPSGGGQGSDDPAVQGLVERVAFHGPSQNRQHFLRSVRRRDEDGVGRLLHRRDELVAHRREHRMPGRMGADGDNRTAPQPQRFHEILWPAQERRL
jgi:hypothetical protein